MLWRPSPPLKRKGKKGETVPRQNAIATLMSVERLVTISKDHPSLVGHFPGNPVVPGVVILEEVLETIRQTEPGAISVLGAPSVKFHSPLRPDEVMTIRLEPYHDQVRGFSCMSGTKRIASGLFKYQRAKTAVRSQE